jgi:hypothetical protein
MNICICRGKQPENLKSVLTQLARVDFRMSMSIMFIPAPSVSSMQAFPPTSNHPVSIARRRRPAHGRLHLPALRHGAAVHPHGRLRRREAVAGRSRRQCGQCRSGDGGGGRREAAACQTEEQVQRLRPHGAAVKRCGPARWTLPRLFLNRDSCKSN